MIDKDLVIFKLLYTKYKQHTRKFEEKEKTIDNLSFFPETMSDTKSFKTVLLLRSGSGKDEDNYSQLSNRCFSVEICMYKLDYKSHDLV